MDTGQKRPNFAVYRSARTVALLAFGLACGSALASSSPAPCNEAARNTQNLDIPASELNLHKVDLGTTDSVAAGPQRPERVPESSKWASPSLALIPRAESIVNKMFEEPQYSPSSQTDPTPADAALTAPVAETVTPTHSGEKAERRNDVDAMMQSEEVSGITTRVPGVTADDLLRFKRRMYRTDI